MNSSPMLSALNLLTFFPIYINIETKLTLFNIIDQDINIDIGKFRQRIKSRRETLRCSESSTDS